MQNLTTQSGQPQWFAAPANVISINIALPMQGDQALNQPIDHINRVNAAHVANITVNLKMPHGMAPDSAGTAAIGDDTLSTDSAFSTQDTQMAVIRKLHAIHEQTDVSMNKAFGAHQPPLPGDFIKQATQVAHQIMAELLRGNMVLRVAPDDINNLLDHIRDQALQYMNGLKNPADFCPHKMKNTIMNHPKIRAFKEKHDPRHGHWTNMKYHPDTGMPSHTVLSAHMEYRGQADEMQHGSYVSTHVDH